MPTCTHVYVVQCGIRVLPLEEYVCHIFEGFWSALLELVVYNIEFSSSLEF